MPPETDLSPDKIARIKKLYTAGAVPLSHILTEENISRYKLDRLRQHFDWSPHPGVAARKTPCDKLSTSAKNRRRRIKSGSIKKAGVNSKKKAKTCCRNAAKPADDSAVMAMVRRLTRALQGELAAAEQREASVTPATAETSARTLASIARTLTTLRALEESGAEGKRARRSGNTDKMDIMNDDPPLDLAELRRELARRLDRLRSDGESA